MARPVNRWDPSRNVDLIVKAADGPLVIEGADSRWRNVAREWTEPTLYDVFDLIAYLREITISGSAPPLDGLRIRGYQFMPTDMTFFGADPMNGEPQPDDQADLFSGERYNYVTTGFRMALRGWIGSFLDEHLNVELEVWWADGEQRNAADARGAWTGAVLSVLNLATVEADHLAYALHGKRQGDPSWEYRGAYVDQPIAAYTPSGGVVSPVDGVDSGRVRILINGASPAWTVQTQRWDGAAWVDITSSVVDLRAYAVPGEEDAFFLNGYLFHGATRVNPAMPPVGLWQDTYFNRVSVSQFQPWVLDTDDINLREILARIDAILHSMFPIPYWLFPVEAKMPAIDAMHIPSGPNAPIQLRVLDPDGGWGVQFGPDTIIVMVGIEDRKGLTVTSTAGKYMPVCLADDDMFSHFIPFSYVGRYKLDDLAAWADERTLVSFGRAGFHPTPSAGNSGIGMTWRPANGGELVLKFWDGVALSWKELTAPLRVDEYDGEVVDIGFAWTGMLSILGLETLEPDSQLRIVVDGVTLSTVIEPALTISGTSRCFIGTGNPTHRKSFTGIWFGGATFYEPVTNTDLLHAFDAEGEGGFENPSFETADESGRPGEAEAWEWQSFQGVGGFAEFSAYRAALAAYRGGVEGFEGGWRRAPAWVYADGTARLAATGFTADDVGQAAHQLDIDRNYILTNHSPITWVESVVGENQGWADDLSSLAAALFNAGIPSFETTVETFDIWGGTWDLMVWSGRPWLAAYNLVPPCQDTLGPFGGPTGFDGWYDHLYATNLDPLCVESFEEAWGNDPFSTAGGQAWQPHTAPGGRLRGEAVSFPLFVPSNENRLIIITDGAIPAMFSLPSSSYPDMASLLSALNGLLAVHLPGLGLAFGSWSDGSSEGLTFGWDGSTLAALWFGFATLEREMFKDARGRLGLKSFSTGGNYSGVGIPAWFFPSLPAGVLDTDRFLLDTWSANSFLIVTDPALGTVALENDMVAAVFDTAVPDPTMLERFLLTGWVSPLAIWISDLSAVPLTQAMFDSGTHDREDFLDTEWPDEMFPT